MVLLSAAVVSPNNEAPKALASQPTHQSATEQNPIKKAWESVFPDSISFFTFALVTCTILLWRATLKLAREGRQSANAQLEKMERSISEAAKAAAAMESLAEATRDASRPWVAVTDIETSTSHRGFASDGTPLNNAIGFMLVVVNTGSRPAINWTVNLKAVASPKDAPIPEVRLDPADEITGVMTVNEVKHIGPAFLSDEDTVEFRERRSKAIIYARMTYQGAATAGEFNYETEFCLDARHLGGTFERNGKQAEAIQYRPVQGRNHMK